MKETTFYPALQVKVSDLSNIGKGIIKGVTAEGEKVNIQLNIKGVKPENFKEAINKILNNNKIPDTLIATITGKIQHDNEIGKKISDNVQIKYPDLRDRPLNIQMQLLNEEYVITAKQIARDIVKLQYGSIIQVAGITSAINKDGEMNVKTLINPNGQGLYIQSSPNNFLHKKLPIVMIPTKNNPDRYRTLLNSKLITIEDYEFTLTHYIKTLKAFYNQKVNSKPFITFYTKNQKLRNIVDKMNIRLSEAPDNFIDIKNIVTNIFNYIKLEKLHKEIPFFLPIEPINKDISVKRTELATTLMRTTYANSPITDKEILSNIDNVALIYNGIYKLSTDKDGFGFFANNTGNEIVNVFTLDRCIDNPGIQKIIKDRKEKEKETIPSP